MTAPAPLQTAVGPLASLAFLVAGVGVLLVFARRSVWRLSAMLGTETTPVEQVSPGTVEVEGTVVSAGETFDTNLTFGVDQDVTPVVSEYRSDNDNETDNPTAALGLPIPQQLAPNVFNDTDVAPFYVEDDSGRVLVDAARADLSLDTDARQEYGSMDKQVHVEAFLEPGDAVSVHGTAVPVEDYPARATERGGVLRSILRFLNPDTRIGADEVLDDENLVITRTPGDEFVVSDTSEWRSWLRQGLMAAFWTLAGLFLVAAALYSLAVAAGVV